VIVIARLKGNANGLVEAVKQQARQGPLRLRSRHGSQDVANGGGALVKSWRRNRSHNVLTAGGPPTDVVASTWV